MPFTDMEKHIRQMVFNLDESNLLLNAAFKNDNYKILNGLGHEEICLVFCSSHGVYFQNEVDDFMETIICNDRYEWAHIAAELLTNVKKIILIRDIRKSFYITGINNRQNNIDKLIKLIKNECNGYRIITIGSSSGGYLASIIGAKLYAYAVFCFSGQWNLYEYNDVIEHLFFMNKYADSKMHNKYFNFIQTVKESEVPIFYFYPSKSGEDVKQAEYVRDVSNVYSLALDSDKHGQGLVTTESYVKLIMMSVREVKKLCISYKGKSISPDRVSELISKIF